MNAPALVIFDLAGTTVRDRGEVQSAFLAAFEREGLSLNGEQLRAVRGMSKREATLSLLPDEGDRLGRAERVHGAFRDELRTRYAAGSVEPIPGATAVLAWLRRRRVLTALNTGFDREITSMLLSSLQWTQVADVVVCGDDVARGRPAPDLILRAMEWSRVSDVRAVASIGDTVHDLQAGSHAGVAWNIGVLSGAHDRAALAAEPHTHLLASVADLPSLWP